MFEYVIISQKTSHEAISVIGIEYHLLSYFDKRSEKSLRRLPTCIALLNILNHFHVFCLILVEACEAEI